MFRLNTNVDKKDRSVVSMRDFKGLDTVHSPMNISYQHAIDMRNLINRNGVNRKRHGWRQEKSFDKEAFPLGTWSGDMDFSDNEDTSDVISVIVHFSVKSNELLIDVVNLSNDRSISVIQNFTLNNVDASFVKAVYFEKNLYIVGIGKILIAHPQIESDTYSLNIYDLEYLQANNNDLFYIPTTVKLGATTVNCHDYWWLDPNTVPIPFDTYLQIAADFYCVDDYYFPSADHPNGEDTASDRLDNIIPLTQYALQHFAEIDGTVGDYSVELSNSFQKINALTKRVKNIATITLSKEDYALTNNSLEKKQFKTKVFRIDQMCGYSDAYWDSSWTGSYDEEMRAYFQARESYYNDIKVTVSSNIGVNIEIDGFMRKHMTTNNYPNPEKDIFIPKNGNEDWNICFCGKNLCIDVGNLVSNVETASSAIEFEIIVEFERRTAQDADKIVNLLSNSNMITLFGAEGNPNRLFFGNGANIFYSEYRNPLYIGAQNTIVLGSTPITGWIKGTETSLYVFKQYSRQEESLYVIDGELVTSEDNQYNVNEGEVVFRNKGYMLPESAVNQDSVCSLANDVLIVSNDCVYGVTLSANVASTERFARSRAEQIKNLLQEQDLSKAKCVVLDNKMFLAVDGLVFVADARFRASFDGDMADTFNYEWWLWDNVPLKYWVVIQDKLCFVTDDNRICAFYDGFSDYIFDDLLVAVLDDDGVTISKEYADYNKIVLNAAYKACVDSVDITGIINGALVVNSERLYTAINEGDTVYFDVTAGTISGYPVTVNTPYTVKSIDILNGQVTFTTADGTAVAFMSAMAPLLQANPLRISKAATQQYDMEIDATAESNNTRISDADGNIVRLIEYNGVSSYSATIYKNKPVTAYWQTGSYDFGSSMYAKTIERFSVAFDRESPKKMKLYFSTAYNGKNQLFKELKKNLDFDFENLSFLLFTFDKRFETSYTRRLLIRNFNFISFLLSSDEAEDFSVDSMSFVYKVNKLNRGER